MQHPAVFGRTVAPAARALPWALLRKLRRRMVYACRFAWWTARHGSMSSARWVLAFEGITWNDDEHLHGVGETP